jgi:hypothetical protein
MRKTASLVNHKTSTKSFVGVCKCHLANDQNGGTQYEGSTLRRKKFPRSDGQKYTQVGQRWQCSGPWGHCAAALFMEGEDSDICDTRLTRINIKH